MRTHCLAIAGIVLTACLGGVPVAEERLRPRIGPEATCDPAELGCWHEIDRAALAEIAMRFEESGAGALEEAGPRLCTVAQELAGRLGHKLTMDQYDALVRRAELVCAGGPQDESTVTAHAAGLLAEQMLPLQLDAADAYADGAALEAEAWGDADCPACAGGLRWPRWGWVPETWPVGARTTLLNMASQPGAGGGVRRVYVAFLVANGLFDTDFVRENARLFGDLDPWTGAIRPSTLSQEEQLARIEADARSKARWIGGISGLLSSGGWIVMTGNIPLGASITASGAAHRMLRIHLLQLRTALQTAAVYGFDPTGAWTVDYAIRLALEGGDESGLVDAGLAVGVEQLPGILAALVLSSMALGFVDDIFDTTLSVAAERLVGALASVLAVGGGVAVGAAIEGLVADTYCISVSLAFMRLRRTCDYGNGSAPPPICPGRAEP